MDKLDSKGRKGTEYLPRNCSLFSLLSLSGLEARA